MAREYFLLVFLLSYYVGNRLKYMSFVRGPYFKAEIFSLKDVIFVVLNTLQLIFIKLKNV